MMRFTMFPAFYAAARIEYCKKMLFPACIASWAWVIVSVTTPATPLQISVCMRNPAGYFFGGWGGYEIH